ncbi:arginine N-succinyltransferase [Thioalkalivibrio paradoxus ARh 1]|uniref:Arginine N-succinyltransferase n=1 Tax=Thioalkalivibrio paradoxus ARh 1 TaxID=713585 RepID=W0DNF9_9GAMM|nr:arginine N-succinyltransferase [Thioalkalivibrio paradoxus ARh 1]
MSAAEERILDEKLDRLRGVAGEGPDRTPGNRVAPGDAERPEIYREDPERRRIEFSERELNGLIARDPALAGRAAVRLSPGQVSASFRVDLPEEIPLFGGRRLRVQTGLQLLTRDERVQARLVGVSVAGVPLPDAWLGGLKGQDLLATSGLAALGAGIEALQVDDGRLDLLLAP